MGLLKHGRRSLERLPRIDAWFRRLAWSRVHFPEYELRLIAGLRGRPIDVAIDVGGALGSYAWTLGRKSRRVIVFEPGAFHNRFLNHAVAFSAIEVERAAVGNVPGELSLYTPGNDVNARHSATLSADNPTIDTATATVSKVPVVTIDDYAARHLGAEERVDLLKVDVEGFELAVFQGAMRRIERDHPLVICEIEARHNTRYREVFELLAAFGYSAYFARGGKMVAMDAFDLEPLQSSADLAYRVSDAYKPGHGAYINNFVFEHPSSRVKFTDGTAT